MEKKKKTYRKPKIHSDQAFERMALSCTKVDSGSCGRAELNHTS
jgi:hypothetical protein